MTSRPDVHTWALELADTVSKRSRDPSTKVGAVILRPDNTVVSMGYNGFPRNVNDDESIYNNRPRKLLRTIHAELNAILTAHERLDNCTIYISPLFPCANCAACIIQTGIKRVICRMPDGAGAKWADSFEEAKSMFKESGVDFEMHP